MHVDNSQEDFELFVRSSGLTVESSIVLRRLLPRIGLFHLQQRVQIESEGNTRLLRKIRVEDLLPMGSLLRCVLQILGLYQRGKRNALKLQVNENRIYADNLPAQFDGFTILQMSDLHLDLDGGLSTMICEKIHNLHYDICVLSGDYLRHGSIRSGETRSGAARSLQQEAAIMQQVVACLHKPINGVLGNHDSIHGVAVMEEMGIRMLLNEATLIEKEGARIYLAGVDDYHYFRLANIEKARQQIPAKSYSILLSHSPEQFRQAAYAGFDVYFCGHTHAGQICLPGGFPISLNIDCSREVGRGRWQFKQMQGYTSSGCGTSVIDIRFNCLPEVTLHTLCVDNSNHHVPSHTSKSSNR